MKVKITLTVDVDHHGWEQEYGTMLTVAALKADVREHVAQMVSQQLEALGVGR